jgi:hypothetical protein
MRGAISRNSRNPLFVMSALTKSRVHNIRPFKLNFREFFAAFESDRRFGHVFTMGKADQRRQA